MYAITGISGQIGGVIGRVLLDVRQPVRAVFRGPDGKRQNQTLVRLLRRSDFAAHRFGVIFHSAGRIL